MLVSTWFAFFLACWAISLSPGAGAIASMSCGLQYGFARGYWNALGLQIGLALQIAIVAAGVGALLATSALAFSLIKWFGVAYLVYLAVAILVAPRLGAATFIACVVAGQMLVSALCDQFGWAGFPVRRLSWEGYLGLALVVAGVLLLQWRGRA